VTALPQTGQRQFEPTLLTETLDNEELNG